MKIFDVTLNNYEEIPRYFKQGEEFDSILIIPTTELHDSGFARMAFIGCKSEEAVCLRGGGSDVLDLDGIGGSGIYYVPTIRPKSWSIDCTPNGLLRIFAHKCKLRFDDIIVSSCGIYAIPRKEGAQC